LTDTLNLYRQLLYECITRGDFLANLLVREHHFVEGIAEHGTALLKIPAFGNNLWPLHQLTHVPGADLRVFSSEIYHFLNRKLIH
jgi:hypothetical protein